MKLSKERNHVNEARSTGSSPPKCAHCEKRIPRARLGRPAKFCSRKCKERARKRLPGMRWNEKQWARARAVGAPREMVTRQQIEELRWKQGDRCARCGHRLPSRRGSGPDCWQVDHKRGIKAGHLLRNLQILCAPCHWEKSTEESGYRITAVKVKKIRRASKKLKHREVAKRFRLPVGAVAGIRQRKTWRWVA